MLATILDPAGAPVARATAALHGNGTIDLDPSRRARQRLFEFYFLRGERQVALDLGDVVIRGRLRTGMDKTRRKWWVTLQSAAPVENTDERPARVA
jgi:hypothetical protein